MNNKKSPGHNLIEGLFEPLKKERIDPVGCSYIDQKVRLRMESSFGEAERETYCHDVAEMLHKKLCESNRWEALVRNVFMNFLQNETEIFHATYTYQMDCIALMEAIATQDFKAIQIESVIKMLKAIMDFCQSMQDCQDTQTAIDYSFVD